jgi:conserved plasmodium protein
MESINIADRDMLFWAGSPNEFNDDNSNEFNVNDDGNLNNDNVNNNNGVRGVFSLQSEYYYTKRVLYECNYSLTNYG